MRFLKWLLITVIVIGAFFVGGAYFLPDKVRVERSTVIEASAADIFPYLNNFRRFNEWSPWAERDPDTQYRFSGPDQGVGATMSWRSDASEVGSGEQEIVESVRNEKVVTRLDFGERGQADAMFLLDPDGDETRVTWTLESQLPPNPVSRWMGLMLDGLIGQDYEEGLARLKTKVESGGSV